MGTYGSLTVPAAEAARLDEYAAAVGRILGDLEAALSIYRDDSEISRVNDRAGRGPVSVSPHTARLLELSKQFGASTEGAFDITVAPLVRLWGFSGGTRLETLPSPEAVAAASGAAGIAHLVLSNGTAYLDQPGAAVDLGGIGKGYAVDVCVAALRERGAENFLMNLGGNMRGMGTRNRDTPWRIGIRNPFDRQNILGTLALPGGMAVATSGNYEKFVEIEGRRYSHIIDPATGRPVEGVAGVTAVAATATDADALSTALFVLGEKRGVGVLRKFPGAEALWVPDRQPTEIRLTPGLRRWFRPAPEFADRVFVLDAEARFERSSRLSDPGSPRLCAHFAEILVVLPERPDRVLDRPLLVVPQPLLAREGRRIEVNPCGRQILQPDFFQHSL
jgi:thiamine biosynthesis lipoprotein